MTINVENIINHVDLEKSAKSSGKGGGWLSAIAEAMGKAMGMQAARVVALSAAIADNAEARSLGTGPAAAAQNAKLAAQGQALNAQFSAASQELSYTSNSFSTAIKALGESSSTMVRKN